MLQYVAWVYPAPVSRDADKAAKPLNLAEHSGPIASTVNLRTKRQAINGEESLAEFESGNYLLLNRLDSDVISKDFTISLWIYLEGGQADNARILSESMFLTLRLSIFSAILIPTVLLRSG